MLKLSHQFFVSLPEGKTKVDGWHYGTRTTSFAQETWMWKFALQRWFVLTCLWISMSIWVDCRDMSPWVYVLAGGFDITVLWYVPWSKLNMGFPYWVMFINSWIGNLISIIRIILNMGMDDHKLYTHIYMYMYMYPSIHHVLIVAHMFALGWNSHFESREFVQFHQDPDYVMGILNAAGIFVPGRVSRLAREC